MLFLNPLTPILISCRLPASLLHMNREFLSKSEPENMNVDAVECLPMLTATSVSAGSYVTKVFEWVVLFLPDVTDLFVKDCSGSVSVV